MPYVGSYIWKIRQKIGHDLLVMPTVDVLAIRDDGSIMMIYNKDFDGWGFPGGYVEPERTWAECALAELEEEAGITTDKSNLVPFASISGQVKFAEYASGDKVQGFGMIFLCHKWSSETDAIDEVEISDKRFFTPAEIEELQIADIHRLAFSAYKKYLETSEFQTIEG